MEAGHVSEWGDDGPRQCSLCTRRIPKKVIKACTRTPKHCSVACKNRAADLRRKGRTPLDPGYFFRYRRNKKRGRNRKIEVSFCSCRGKGHLARNGFGSVCRVWWAACDPMDTRLLDVYGPPTREAAPYAYEVI